ncbi:MAG TPA: hypothetical protein VN429_11265 [Methanospirillum sp.]|uniref:CD3072 family TudS-related putative desulfidase n=1 Tax=Methanospirillum sp. TaxID=45200 RepID=UPI002C6E58CB|nr:CD3072 family TudS-related putative desulfidase [Methanospirillum sp.]HWQ64987.1 hypothetical protein [Methanospirillum sp.]
MNRAKKIILVAHCLLNVNAKVDGLARYQGVHDEIISSLIQKGYGIIQLPCPEMGYYGIRRWGNVFEQMDIPAYRRYCRKILSPIVDQIQDYQKNEYEIAGVIGVDKSPSCGVHKTCCSDRYKGEITCINNLNTITNSLCYRDGQGIFIEEFHSLILETGISIPFYAIDEESSELTDPIHSFML